MAFFNRVGSILRQSVSHNSASSSLMNSIRCMSSSKLFIGGLSFGTDDHSLKDAFSGFGDVVDAKVITDRDTGRSRGFGFVSFSDSEAAGSAMSAMDGQDLNGRSIRIGGFEMAKNLCKYYIISRNSTLGRFNSGRMEYRRTLHNGPDTVEELLDRHLVKEKPVYDDDEDNELLIRQRLTSTRREVLCLYRDIIRATRFFMWPDSRGVLWRDILRANARKEFEEARFEKDPEVVTRLLIGGRDAVQAALDKLAEKHREALESHV